MNKLRKGDQVEVICGKDKGRRGTIQSMIGNERVLVEGINVMIRHTKPNPMANIPGGKTEKIKSIHISNLMLVNPTSGKAERVKVRMKSVEKDGKTVHVRERYFPSNDSTLPS